MRDLRFAFRQLLKNPSFTAVAVLTLALGIGANLALFQILDEEFLAPRPVRRPEELWAIVPMDRSGEPSFFRPSRPYYEAIRKYQRVFKNIACIGALYTKVRTAEGWESVRGALVSGNYFDFVGVHPMMGRGFLGEQDDKPGATSVVVLSFELWQRLFLGDPAILGKTVDILSLKPGPAFVPVTRVAEVVGIAPPGFRGLAQTSVDFWLPLGMDNLFPSNLYSFFGRLDPDANPAAAADSLVPIVRELNRTLHPSASAGQALSLASKDAASTRVALYRAGYGRLRRAFPTQARRHLIQLNGLTALGTLLVLAISTSNLASLFLARALARRKAMAVCLALGATRWVAIRPLLLEGMLLAAAGGVSALLVLNWAGHLAPTLFSAVVIDTDVPVIARIDFYAAAIALVGAVLVGVAFSLVPAWQAACFDSLSVLRNAEGTGATAGRRSFRKLLVVAQVAAALTLLTGACLCLRTIGRQLRTDVGFQTRSLAVAQLDLEKAGYTTNTAPAFLPELSRRISRLPAVEQVAMTDFPPYSGRHGSLLAEHVEDHEGERVLYVWTFVGPDFFRTLGIALLVGREVSTEDIAQARPVALVNESFAKKYWPNQDALGKRIDGFRGGKCEVIGVVRDGRLESPLLPAKPTAYFACNPFIALQPTLLVRTRSDSKLMVNLLQAELLRADPKLRDSRILTLPAAMERSLLHQQGLANLLAELAAVALGLTGLGSYGLMSYLVKQRTHEIGVRLALGAAKTAVVAHVLRSGLWLALSGIGLGLPVASGGALFLRHLVPGLSPFDLPAFSLAAGVVLLAILLASWLPARNAAKIDPMEALRYE